MSEYAVMPLTDYKGICDKVREKVGSKVVRFEDMGFGYLVSAPFKVEQGKTYTLNMEFTDSNLYWEGYITDSGWADDISPWLFIEQNPYTFTADFTFEVCIYLRNSKGLTVNDIVSLNIECDGEVVENFVFSTIKSGEMSEKIDAVYEAGQQAEYDKFWDIFQKNGTRTYYNYVFTGFYTTYFYPKYDIKPVSAIWCFRDMVGTVIDLTERLNECGVKIDTSNCTDMSYCYYNSPFSRVPEMDMRKAGTTGNTLMFGKNVETVDKFIISDTGTQAYDQTFGYASALKNIVIKGVFGQNTNFKDCPLSIDSMKSVISHLKNYAGTDKELTYKVTFTSACWTKLEASGTAPDGNTWKEYVQLTLGWNC